MLFDILTSPHSVNHCSLLCPLESVCPSHPPTSQTGLRRTHSQFLHTLNQAVHFTLFVCLIHLLIPP